MQAISPTGYFAICRPPSAGNTPTPHRFCGSHSVAGATCPNCDKPLLRFFSFATADSRIGISDAPFGYLPLLFCWTCNLAQAPFTYRVTVSGAVELLGAATGGVQTSFPYKKYPVAFEEGDVELVAVTAEEQELIRSLNEGKLDEFDLPKEKRRLSVPVHQVGGEPFLVQRGGPDESCPVCDQSLRRLAVVGDTTLNGRGFTGNAYVQVSYLLCNACWVLHATQRAD